MKPENGDVMSPTASGSKIRAATASTATRPSEAEPAQRTLPPCGGARGRERRPLPALVSGKQLRQMRTRQLVSPPLISSEKNAAALMAMKTCVTCSGKSARASTTWVSRPAPRRGSGRRRKPASAAIIFFRVMSPPPKRLTDQGSACVVGSRSLRASVRSRSAAFSVSVWPPVSLWMTLGPRRWGGPAALGRQAVPQP